jgi:hypothetical protein
MKIAIIGSGISGLYLGNKLFDDNIDFDIYEKNSKIGGRVKIIRFDNIDVVAGAGIGRYNKDKLLYNLCKEFNVSIKEYTSKIFYTFNYINILDIIKKLEIISRNLTKEDRSGLSFSQFAKKNLEKDEYKKFILSCGYTDFLKADIIDTIYDYGFDDVISGMKAFSIKWNDLLENIYKKLKNHIILNKKVTNIVKLENNKFRIKTKIYDKIIFATDKYDFDILNPRKLYNNIKCQSFVRLYVKLNKNIEYYSGFIFTEKPFQKIIEIDKDKNIYMISYSDNNIADKWNKVENIKKEVEKGIKKIFNQNIKVLKHKLIYWNCGTHYFKPLSKNFENRDEFLEIVQNPVKNIFVVGEGLSKNQGWCEGGLESVKKIYEKITG